MRSALFGTLAGALALAPSLSSAVPIWATWSAPSSTTREATLPGGRTATFTGFPTSFSNTPTPGTVFGTVPGLASGVHPPSMTFFSADVGAMSIPGDLIFELDLTGFAVDSETLFGLEDALDNATYRLELLDSSRNPLSLASLQLSQFNLDYSSVGGGIQDYDLSLDSTTGILVAVRVHDSGDPTAGRHSALAIFTGLPLATAYLRLYAAGSAPFLRDGLRLALGGSPVPEPSLALMLTLAGAGFACGAARSRRR